MDEDQPSHVHEHNKIHLWHWCLKYSSFVYKRPYVPIITSAVAFIAFTTWLCLVYGISPYANINYYRWSRDEISDKWDAYVGAGKQTYGSLFGLFGHSLAMPAQLQMTQMGALIYERLGNKNILSAEAMSVVWKLEDEVHSTPGWSDYCVKLPMDGTPEFIQAIILDVMDFFKDLLSFIEPETYCVDFKSLATEIKMYMKDLPEFEGKMPTPEDLTDEIVKTYVMNVSKTDAVVGTYFGSDWDEDKFFTNRIRSMVPFGVPIAGYRNKVDRQDEQERKMGKWQAEFLKPVKVAQKAKTMGVVPYSGFAFEAIYEMADYILAQVWWLVGSFAFLFLFSIVAMRTFFVALLGTFGVWMPIPCALLTLHAVTRIMHVYIIYIIALFSICGIAADCIFIIFELFSGQNAFIRQITRGG